MLEIIKHLAQNGIITENHFSEKMNDFFIDLQVDNKSWFYLFENGFISSRYTTHSINMNEPLEVVIEELKTFIMEQTKTGDISVAWYEFLNN